jgi:hypothetical protein
MFNNTEHSAAMLLDFACHGQALGAMAKRSAAMLNRAKPSTAMLQDVTPLNGGRLAASGTNGSSRPSR